MYITMWTEHASLVHIHVHTYISPYEMSQTDIIEHRGLLAFVKGKVVQGNVYIVKP